MNATDDRQTDHAIYRAKRAPAPRTYLKEITIDTSRYEATHGRPPRGYGSWAFAPTHATRGQRPDGTPIQSPDEADLQEQALTAIYHRATYAQAKEQAKHDFASQGTTQITVQP